MLYFHLKSKRLKIKFLLNSGTYDSSGEDQKVTEIYDKPVYVVEIRDSSGKVLHTQTSESPTFNVKLINYPKAFK